MDESSGYPSGSEKGARNMWKAQDFVDDMRDTRGLIRLAHKTGNQIDGYGLALILSDEKQVAIMVEDCGTPAKTLVKGGAIVNFSSGKGKRPQIVGEAAYFGNGPAGSSHINQ